MHHPASQLVSVVEPDGDGGVRVRLAGQLDIATLPRFRRLLTSLTTGGATTIVLDLAELEVIEPAAAEHLVQARRAARTAGVRIEIANARGATAALLDRAAGRFTR